MSSDHDHKVRTLWLAGVLHAFTHLYQLALIPLYLLIQRGLKLESVEQSTLLVTVMGVAYYVPSYPQGVLADRFSRKKLLAIGLAINGLGYVCLGLSPNYACALASVALAGFGGSFYHPAATALVARLYPAKTGRALGLVAIGASAGFFISPIYSGWRAEVTGNWRYPVVEMGAMGIIFSAIFYWLAEEERGAVTMAGAFSKSNSRIAERIPLTPSLSPSGGEGGRRPSEGGCEPEGEIFSDNRGKVGPHGEKLFPTKALWAIFILMAIAFSLRDFSGSGMASLTSLFLQNTHRMNPKTTGLVISGIYLASAVSSPVFGHFSDGGRMRWAVALIFLSIVTVVIFPLVPKEWMFAALAAYGCFFIASYPVVEAAVMESVPDAVRGRVFGLFITFGGLLGNMAHWAAGAMVKHLGPSAASPENYRPLYMALAFMLCAAMIGLPCLHAIRKREGLEPHVNGGHAAVALAATDSALK